jgi:FkbM family methyltransferase
MSCKYFILFKSNDSEIHHDHENQIVVGSSKSYILPKNNINYYIENGLFEKNLIEWSTILCNKDKDMLDIGAHTGTYAISLAKYCNHVYAFEPQKMTYYALCGSVALSHATNVTCLHVGLGSIEQVGKQILNVISVDGGGSTLHKDNNNNSLYNEEIEIKTLDSYNFTNIGFIKLDVENNELQVLKNSINTLKNSNYPKILFEMNDYNHELVLFLKNTLNYSIIKLINSHNMYLASPATIKKIESFES